MDVPCQGPAGADVEPYPLHMAEALRQRATEIFLKGVAAADPVRSTASALRGLDLQAAPGVRVAVLAVGKAAFGMTRAAIEVLGDPVLPADV